ncbi:MAG: nucleotidyl transferase AbiEii/AbiGii toxin family protein [Thermoanaerobaculia bacterium]|nr:nucleotidyl transferase AbiEii/AbiGii toxin family protein [Thermoanaerobaculia bacterium]
MTPLETALRAIAAGLDRRGLRWALVGGLAVSARAEPRTTRDVDVAVAVPDDAAAEALVFSLGTEGWEVAAAVEQSAAGRLATIRLRPPFDRRGRGVVVDVLFASSGIEPEITREAERLEVLPGLVVPVARLGHLIAMKVLSRDDRTRPRDAEDLRGLLAEASDADLALARNALERIAARGFHRGRDLAAEMQRALAELR